MTAIGACGLMRMPSARQVRCASTGSKRPDAVAEADRPGRQGGEQRLGLAVVAGHLGVGAEHVLERHQAEGAGERVGGAEPRPQLAGRGDVAVVAARPHRRDLGERGGLGEVGRRGHAPLQRDAPLAGRPGRCPPARPGPRPGRFAQAAHPEEHLDQPVVLEASRRPSSGTGRASARRPRASRARRSRRRRTRAPRPPCGDVGREVPDVGHERRVAEPARAARRCRRGGRRSRSSHAVIAVGGTTHSSVSNGRSSSCG